MHTRHLPKSLIAHAYMVVPWIDPACTHIALSFLLNCMHYGNPLDSRIDAWPSLRRVANSHGGLLCTYSCSLDSDFVPWEKSLPIIPMDASCLFLTLANKTAACPAARTRTPTLSLQPSPRATSVHEPCAPWPPASSTQLVRSATTPPACNTERIFSMLSHSDLFGRPPRLVADLIASRSAASTTSSRPLYRSDCHV